MKNLPQTVERLSACADSGQSDARGPYWFPEEVRLRVLRLENSCSSVEDLFRQTKFPRLRQLILKDMMTKVNVMRETSRWQTKDIRFLFDAILDDRIPELEDLCVRRRCLKGCGRQVVEVLRRKNHLKTIEFVGTRLGFDDGEILLNAIEEGFLYHVRFLNLLMNPGLNPHGGSTAAGVQPAGHTPANSSGSKRYQGHLDPQYSSVRVSSSE